MKIYSRKKPGKTISTVMIALVIGYLSLPVNAFDYPEPGDFALGAQQWADNCTRCHNLRGPNELRDDQWITTMFHMRVRAGLTGEETRNILTFLQGSNNSLSGVSVVKASAPVAGGADGLSGKDVYNQTCIACHAANGKGALPGVPDMTSKGGRLSQSDEQLLVNVTRGLQSPGATMAMPPKGGNASLNEAELRAVIAYMRSQFGH